MEETTLEACPFCSGSDVCVVDAAQSGQMSEYSRVYCQECFSEGPPKMSDKAAIAAWNRRNPSPYKDNMT